MYVSQLSPNVVAFKLADEERSWRCGRKLLRRSFGPHALTRGESGEQLTSKDETAFARNGRLVLV